MSYNPERRLLNIQFAINKLPTLPTTCQKINIFLVLISFEMFGSTNIHGIVNYVSLKAYNHQLVEKWAQYPERHKGR